MKVTSVASPADIKQPTSNQTAAKSKAIEAFNKASQTHQQPVQDSPIPVNANAISPEDLSAVKAPTEEVPVVAATEETQAPVEVPPKKDPTLEKQFQQLARQERLLRQKAQQQEQAIKAREAALQAKEDAITAKDKQYQQGYISKDQLKQDTLRILADQGISYEELTNQILNQQPANPRLEAHISRLEAQIQELQSKAEANTKTYEQQQQANYQAAVRQIRQDAQSLVKSDPTTYEAIAKTNSISDVVDLIEQTYKKDGIVLSVEEAAQEVENYLVEEGVNTLSRIDKIKKKIAQAGATAGKASSQQLQAKPIQQSQPMKTLTNASSSTRKLSAKERAMLAFKGELKP